jgi:carotenoid cleavage dioxygenase-like enzyme
MKQVSKEVAIASYLQEGEMKGMPYLAGMFAPVDKEITAENLKVEGEIPRDFGGMYVRNSPNPKYRPKRKHNWFDGDGMLHGVHIENGKATYRNRYVRTQALTMEDQAGEALYNSIIEMPDFNLPGKHSASLKDTGNTDIVFHNGNLKALWWLSGDPYSIKLPELETIGADNLKGELKRNMAAHAKVCPVTGDLMFYDFDMRPPYLTYGVVDKTGNLKHYVPIDLPGYRMQHDMAITPNYSILFDLPLYWDTEAMKRGKFMSMFNRDLPSRFGIIPRFGQSHEIRWFEAPTVFIYHMVNAYELNENELVMHACTIDKPIVPKGEESDAPTIGFMQLEPKLAKYIFNLKTGKTTTYEILDDVWNEFPIINTQKMGLQNRYSYNCRFAHNSELLFDALIKYDYQKNSNKHYEYGEHRFGSEAAFAPRTNAQSEDDGYLVTFVYDGRNDTSVLEIIDAQNFEKGAVAKIHIPQRVPIGFHACWVSQAEMMTEAV